MRENRKLSLTKDAKSLQPFLLWQRGLLIIYYPSNPSLTLSGFTTFLFKCDNQNQIKCTKCFWLWQKKEQWPLWLWTRLWWKLSVGSHTGLPLQSNEIPRTFFFFNTWKDVSQCLSSCRCVVSYLSWSQNLMFITVKFNEFGLSLQTVKMFLHHNSVISWISFTSQFSVRLLSCQSHISPSGLQG